MRALDEALGRAAGTDLPVLFRGERGAGKGRCARRLHTLRHPGAPYLCLAAATLGADGPDPVALRLVQGGSLYLAGLEHLAPEAAAPLARAMDAAGSDIHWMAGLEAGAALAPGLAQRLGALELNVPPLRERREDLLALARALLEVDARRVGRTTPWLERAAERQLLEQPWPGNVRDLQALLARSLAHAEGTVIRAFPDLGADGAEPMSLPWPAPGSLEAMMRVAARVAEGQLLRRALAQAGGDLPRAAEGLGLSVRSLGQRLRDQGISLEDDGGSSLPRKAT
jgi:DNA-binding NtrC family response regulator